MNGSAFNLSSLSSPVVIVDQVIAEAVKRKASDILFEPAEDTVVVRLRIDGYLQAMGDMAPGAYSQALARIKVLGNMDVAENRKPQEAKIRIEVDNHQYVLRVAIVTTNFGQMCALRLLDLPEYNQLSSLGMPATLVERVKQNITGRYGLFLVCGPTGSGKTTTVHACLQHLNVGDVNIMSIEDPVEYVVPGVNQLEVRHESGVDFVTGLRYILRLDPDVVFVGEIRDSETARTAIQAALTGHLVISTIHSRNSIGALYRLIDLGVDKYMINYALRAIVAQRLVRRVCDHCKQPYTPLATEVAAFQSETGRPLSVSMKGIGCEWCNKTGFAGRVGMFELLEMDEVIRKAVSDGVGEQEIRERVKSSGFVSMGSEGGMLVEQGITSLPEFLRTTFDAK